jgi:hypothetical protein
VGRGTFFRTQHIYPLRLTPGMLLNNMRGKPIEALIC